MLNRAFMEHLNTCCNSVGNLSQFWTECLGSGLRQVPNSDTAQSIDGSNLMRKRNGVKHKIRTIYCDNVVYDDDNAKQPQENRLLV